MRTEPHPRPALLRLRIPRHRKLSLEAPSRSGTAADARPRCASICVHPSDGLRDPGISCSIPSSGLPFSGLADESRDTRSFVLLLVVMDDIAVEREVTLWMIDGTTPRERSTPADGGVSPTPQRGCAVIWSLPTAPGRGLYGWRSKPPRGRRVIRLRPLQGRERLARSPRLPLTGGVSDSWPGGT